jgi:hypothetical protein
VSLCLVVIVVATVTYTVEDVFIPDDGCESFARSGDHVLIEYDIYHQNGTVASSAHRPDQLFYLQVNDAGPDDTVHKYVKGMCLNATRKLTWAVAADANLIPIYVQKYVAHECRACVVLLMLLLFQVEVCEYY